ncbi:orphan sodium- and chloride-dependent neurotransmitter transporter NTT5 isoform X3 [Cavia porcellus]|uniref:orphan sodium- and chloride-dependent neurotransmitter transporter NTT5 isoform X3 n=1 Tax=Cavia porcellus TaxID=10141 RepID=UPI002FE3B572
MLEVQDPGLGPPDSCSEHSPCLFSHRALEVAVKSQRVGTQQKERSVAPEMRSSGKGDPPSETNGDAPEHRPDAQTSESRLETSSSSESEVSQTNSGLFPSGQTSVSSGMIWSLAPEDSVPQISNAQAWEIYSLGTQARVEQQQQGSSVEMTPVSVLKSKSAMEQGQEANREESYDFIARPLWPRKVEYLMTLVGYTLRPFNLWHFVYLWLHKGSVQAWLAQQRKAVQVDAENKDKPERKEGAGASFFIIYMIMLLFVGIPLLFLEMAIGQRIHQNRMDSWKIITPWAGGVGYVSFIICFFSSMYMNTVNSWILFYLSHIFQYPVPWEKCPLLKNSSDFDPECAQTTPSVYFWYRQTVKVSDRLEDGGPLVLSLSLPLLVCWCLVGAFMIKGLKSLGKVMCVLVSLSFVILFCFVIWSLLLEGAEHGLKHLLVAKVTAVYDLTVWSVAGGQVLFDLGLGFGPIACLSSHMPQSNNCLYDAFIIAMINLATLFLTTPFILAVLGFWATVLTHRCSEKNMEKLSMLVNMGTLPSEAQPPTNLHSDPTSTYNSWLSGLDPNTKSLVLSEVSECNREEWILQVKEGPGFVFLSFIEVTSFLPRSIFWTILFFLMLLLLGLGTTIGFMQGLIVPLQDSFSFFRKQTKLLIVGISGLMFLCGLFFTRPSGAYLIRLLSEYWTPMPIIFVIICENIAVAWACGARRFLGDMKTLVPSFTFRFVSWVWSYLTPVMLLITYVALLMKLIVKPLTYVAWDSSTSKEVIRHYPSWARILIIIFYLVVIIPIPGYLFYCLVHGIPFRPVKSSPRRKSHIVPSKRAQEKSSLR